jgi:predicted MFS family arabinose efflux permease
MNNNKPKMFHAWVTMTLWWLVNSLGIILIIGFGLVLNDVMHDIGFSTAEAGTLSAIGSIAAVVLTIPLTNWLSRYDPKLVLGILFFVLAADFALNGMATSFWFLAAARALGITVTMVLCGIAPLIQNQWFHSNQMGLVNGCQSAFSTLGQIVCITVIPLLLTAIGGWRGAYYLLAVAFAFLAVLWFAFAKENRTPEYEQQFKEQHAEGSVAALLEAFKTKTFLLISLAYAFTAAGYIVMMTFWPTFALEYRGMDAEASGLVMGLSSIGALIGSLLSGTLSDWLGRRKPVSMIAAVGVAVVYVLLMLVDSQPLMVVLWFFVGLFMYSATPPLFAMTFELGLKPQIIGLGVSMLMVGSQLGMAIGAQIAGILIGVFGLFASMLALAFVPVLHAVTLVFSPETGKNGKLKAASSTAQTPRL